MVKRARILRKQLKKLGSSLERATSAVMSLEKLRASFPPEGVLESYGLTAAISMVEAARDCLVAAGDEYAATAQEVAALYVAVASNAWICDLHDGAPEFVTAETLPKSAWYSYKFMKRPQQKCCPAAKCAIHSDNPRLFALSRHAAGFQSSVSHTSDRAVAGDKASGSGAGGQAYGLD
jgi:hypothetical protein